MPKSRKFVNKILKPSEGAHCSTCLLLECHHQKYAMDAMWSPGEAVLDELPDLTVEEELDRFEDECSRGNAPPSGSVLGKGRRNGSAKRRNKKKYAAAAVTCVGGFGRGMLSEYFRKQAQIPPPGVEIVGKTPSSSIPAGAEPEDPEEVTYLGDIPGLPGSHAHPR